MGMLTDSFLQVCRYISRHFSYWKTYMGSFQITEKKLQINFIQELQFVSKLKVIFHCLCSLSLCQCLPQFPICSVLILTDIYSHTCTSVLIQTWMLCLAGLQISAANFHLSKQPRGKRATDAKRKPSETLAIDSQRTLCEQTTGGACFHSMLICSPQELLTV